MENFYGKYKYNVRLSRQMREAWQVSVSILFHIHVYKKIPNIT